MKQEGNHFFRFLLGFSVMLGISLSLTIGIGYWEQEKSKQEQSATAQKAYNDALQKFWSGN